MHRIRRKFGYDWLYSWKPWPLAKLHSQKLNRSIATAKLVHIVTNRVAIKVNLTWMASRIPDTPGPGLSQETTPTVGTISTWHLFGSSPFTNTFYRTRLRIKITKSSSQSNFKCIAGKPASLSKVTGTFLNLPPFYVFVDNSCRDKNKVPW